MNTIHVKRFYTKFDPDPANPEKMKATDWVEYGPVGSLDKSTTCDKVSRLSAVTPNTDNPANKLALGRWLAIKPLYEAWKAGQELPESGTPLAAWNGVSPEQAEALRMKSIKTVEDVAQLTDSHVQRFGLPGLRDLILSAQRYIASADTRIADAKMGALEAENAALKAEVEEIKQMLLRDMAPEKRGPGRPRKAEVEAA